jgi:hypothetical protein
MSASLNPFDYGGGSEQPLGDRSNHHHGPSHHDRHPNPKRARVSNPLNDLIDLVSFVMRRGLYIYS